MCADRQIARNRTDRLIQSMDRLSAALENVLAPPGPTDDDKAYLKDFMAKLAVQPPLMLCRSAEASPTG